MLSFPRRRPSAVAGAALVASLMVALPPVAPPSTALSATSSSVVSTQRVDTWTDRAVANASFTRGTRHWLATGEHDRLAVARLGHGDRHAAVLRTSTTSTAALNDELNVVQDTVRRRVYRASAWVRTNEPGVAVQLRIREVGDGAELKTSERTFTPRNRRWHRLVLRHPAAATGSALDLNLVAWDLSPRERVVIDDVALQVRDPRTAQPPQEPGAPVGGACLRGRGSNAECGVLWGVYTTQASATEGWARPFTRLEGDIGRRFDLIKRYHDWSNSGGSGQFPDQYERELGASGQRTLYFAWTSNVWSKGTITSWRSIASGRHDRSVIVPAARRIKAWGKPVFLDFDHEMDGYTRTANGSPADYVAAYRHIRRVFDRVGVPNVIWAWVPTGTMANAERIKAMYPGDRFVDWLGYDPYNFHRCNGSSWESPTQSLRPFYDWLGAHISDRKPVLLGEYGSVSDPTDPDRVEQWYAGVSGALASMRRIRAVMQWSSQTSAACDFRITRDPQALRGFRKAGRAPYVTTG
jgi:hypothetical protein